MRHKLWRTTTKKVGLGSWDCFTKFLPLCLDNCWFGVHNYPFDSKEMVFHRFPSCGMSGKHFPLIVVWYIWVEWLFGIHLERRLCFLHFLTWRQSQLLRSPACISAIPWYMMCWLRCATLFLRCNTSLYLACWGCRILTLMPCMVLPCI